MKIVFFLFAFFFFSCVSKKSHKIYQKDNIEFNSIYNDIKKKTRLLYPYNKNVKISFLGKFNDTILVFLNKKRIYSFVKNDYPKIDVDGYLHEVKDVILKEDKELMLKNIRKKNLLKICLLNSRREVEFEVFSGCTFEIHRYSNKWFINCDTLIYR
jgi:hypothetical protein